MCLILVICRFNKKQRASAAVYVRHRAAAIFTKTGNFALKNFKLATLEILKEEAMPTYPIVHCKLIQLSAEV